MIFFVTSGIHNISVNADSTGQIVEIDETNNANETYFSVLPDLAVLNIYSDATVYVLGRSVNISSNITITLAKKIRLYCGH